MSGEKGGFYIGFRALLDQGGLPKEPPLFYKKDRHGLIAGANGTGKSMRLLVPNLLESRGRSLLVIDPKGTLARLTAPVRQRLGDVIVLDPFNVAGLGSTGFNPLARLDPASPSFNADAALVAEAMLTVGGHDPHWDESARVLVAWLSMHEAELARKEGRPPSLANVRRALGKSAGGGITGDDKPFGIVKDAFEACKSDIEAIKNKAGQYTDWNREVSSILATARRGTAFLDDVEIAKDLDGPYTFADFKRQPQTVYLTLPANMLGRHRSWLRLAVSAALNVCLDDPQNKGVRAVFFLDEFAALGRVEIIERNLPLVREYGIQFVPIVQGFGQLEELYGKGWSKFLGNAGAICCFAPGDDLTAKWMSERIGEGLAMMPGFNIGKNPDGTPSSGVSYSFHKIPAVTPFQLQGLPEGFLFVFLAGLSPAVQAFAPWWADMPQWRDAVG